jgi:hypothetical protein
MQSVEFIFSFNSFRAVYRWYSNIKVYISLISSTIVDFKSFPWSTELIVYIIL